MSGVAADIRAPTKARVRSAADARGPLATAMLALAIAAVLAWSLAPAAWQALTAVKADAQITHTPTVYLPVPPTWEHVEALWLRKPLPRYLANSAWVSACATLLCVALAALAASALAWLPGRQRDRVLLALLVVSLFPPILLLFPIYEGVRALGWINHAVALVVPYAALNLPLAVWVLESALRGLPRELDEAARMDGLSAPRRLVRVHLPLVAPALATAGILVFIFSWNEFMLALTFMTRDASKTVTAGIASVGGASIYEIPWGQLSAAIVIATAPLIALVLLFERRIVSGLTRGAIKG
jgi:multiple sugar transport system permease protein